MSLRSRISNRSWSTLHDDGIILFKTWLIAAKRRPNLPSGVENNRNTQSGVSSVPTSLNIHTYILVQPSQPPVKPPYGYLGVYQWYGLGHGSPKCYTKLLKIFDMYSFSVLFFDWDHKPIPHVVWSCRRMFINIVTNMKKYYFLKYIIVYSGFILGFITI